MPGTPATTTKYGIPRWDGTDPADFALQVNAVSDQIDASMAGYAQGTLAAIPAAGKAGRIYRATDVKKSFLDTGAAWLDITPDQPALLSEARTRYDGSNSSAGGTAGVHAMRDGGIMQLCDTDAPVVTNNSSTSDAYGLFYWQPLWHAKQGRTLRWRLVATKFTGGLHATALAYVGVHRVTSFLGSGSPPSIVLDDTAALDTLLTMSANEATNASTGDAPASGNYYCFAVRTTLPISGFGTFTAHLYAYYS